MVIIDKGGVTIHAGLSAFCEIQSKFAFPFAVEWTILDRVSVLKFGEEIQTKKWYSFTVDFLCFFVNLQVTIYEK